MNSPGPSVFRTTATSAANAPTHGLLLAIDPRDALRYPYTETNLFRAHTTADAISDIEQRRPSVITIDWDYEPIDGEAVYRAARRLQSTTVMITTGTVSRVPAALKLGCHAVLLKPFSLSLAANRLGRLLRDSAMPISPSARAILGRGSNQTWPNTACPLCTTSGVVSFDHAGYRQSWYACLECHHVWRGACQE